MDAEVLRELSVITEEEKKILAGRGSTQYLYGKKMIW